MRSPWRPSPSLAAHCGRSHILFTATASIFWARAVLLPTRHAHAYVTRPPSFRNAISTCQTPIEIYISGCPRAQRPPVRPLGRMNPPQSKGLLPAPGIIFPAAPPPTMKSTSIRRPPTWGFFRSTWASPAQVLHLPLVAPPLPGCIWKGQRAPLQRMTSPLLLCFFLIPFRRSFPLAWNGRTATVDARPAPPCRPRPRFTFRCVCFSNPGVASCPLPPRLLPAFRPVHPTALLMIMMMMIHKNDD